MFVFNVVSFLVDRILTSSVQLNLPDPLEVFECIAGTDCIVSLTGSGWRSSLGGALALSPDIACSTPSTEQNPVQGFESASDASVYDFDLGYIETGGSFSLCWADNVERALLQRTFSGSLVQLVGTLTVLGPVRDSLDTLICFLGAACVVSPSGVSVSISQTLFVRAPLQHSIGGGSTGFRLQSVCQYPVNVDNFENLLTGLALEVSSITGSMSFDLGRATFSKWINVASITVCWKLEQLDSMSIRVGYLNLVGPSLSQDLTCRLGRTCNPSSYQQLFPLEFKYFAGCSDDKNWFTSTDESVGYLDDVDKVPVRGSVGVMSLCWSSSGMIGDSVVVGNIRIIGPSIVKPGGDENVCSLGNDCVISVSGYGLENSMLKLSEAWQGRESSGLSASGYSYFTSVNSHEYSLGRFKGIPSDQVASVNINWYDDGGSEVIVGVLVLCWPIVGGSSIECIAGMDCNIVSLASHSSCEFTVSVMFFSEDINCSNRKSDNFGFETSMFAATSAITANLETGTMILCWASEESKFPVMVGTASVDSLRVSTYFCILGETCLLQNVGVFHGRVILVAGETDCADTALNSLLPYSATDIGYSISEGVSDTFDLGKLSTPFQNQVVFLCWESSAVKSFGSLVLLGPVYSHSLSVACRAGSGSDGCTVVLGSDAGVYEYPAESQVGISDSSSCVDIYWGDWVQLNVYFFKDVQRFSGKSWSVCFRSWFESSSVFLAGTMSVVGPLSAILGNSVDFLLAGELLDLSISGIGLSAADGSTFETAGFVLGSDCITPPYMEIGSISSTLISIRKFSMTHFRASTGYKLCVKFVEDKEFIPIPNLSVLVTGPIDLSPSSLLVEVSSTVNLPVYLGSLALVPIATSCISQAGFDFLATSLIGTEVTFSSVGIFHVCWKSSGASESHGVFTLMTVQVYGPSNLDSWTVSLGERTLTPYALQNLQGDYWATSSLSCSSPETDLNKIPGVVFTSKKFVTVYEPVISAHLCFVGNSGVAVDAGNLLVGSGPSSYSVDGVVAGILFDLTVTGTDMPESSLVFISLVLKPDGINRCDELSTLTNIPWFSPASADCVDSSSCKWKNIRSSRGGEYLLCWKSLQSYLSVTLSGSFKIPGFVQLDATLTSASFFLGEANRVIALNGFLLNPSTDYLLLSNVECAEEGDYIDYQQIFPASITSSTSLIVSDSAFVPSISGVFALCWCRGTCSNSGFSLTISGPSVHQQHVCVRGYDCLIDLIFPANELPGSSLVRLGSSVESSIASLNRSKFYKFSENSYSSLSLGSSSLYFCFDFSLSVCPRIGEVSVSGPVVSPPISASCSSGIPDNCFIHSLVGMDLTGTDRIAVFNQSDDGDSFVDGFPLGFASQQMLFPTLSEFNWVGRRVYARGDVYSLFWCSGYLLPAACLVPQDFKILIGTLTVTSPLTEHSIICSLGTILCSILISSSVTLPSTHSLRVRMTPCNDETLLGINDIVPVRSTSLLFTYSFGSGSDGHVLAGTYRICWSADPLLDSHHTVDIGILTFRGPIRNQVFACTLGFSCVLDKVLGINVLTGDTVMTVKDNCSDRTLITGWPTDANGLGTIVKSNATVSLTDPTSTNSDSSLLLSGVGGSEAILCWCGLDSSCSEWVEFGRLMIIGPARIGDGDWTCVAGVADCMVQVEFPRIADSIESQISLKNSPDCSGDLVDMINPTATSTNESTNGLASFVFPGLMNVDGGIYMLCWESLVFLGTLTIVGPVRSYRSTCNLIGGSCIMSGISGTLLGDGDVMRIPLNATSCSNWTGNGDFITSLKSNVGDYKILFDPAIVKTPGDYPICWCSRNVLNPTDCLSLPEDADKNNQFKIQLGIITFH